MTFRMLALVGVAVAASASAQQPLPMPSSDEIVVTGSREGTLDLRRLRRAEAVFQAGQPAFAPASMLLFQLRPRDRAELTGMTLRLRAGDRTIPVPVDQQGRFTLPPRSPGPWELEHNRGRAKIAIRPLVFSPGATEADRPLGDLRLQCRVGWELLKPTYSVFARAGFEAMGGCASSRIAIFFYAPHPITAASITSATGRMELPISTDHRSFRPPIFEQAMANSARVRVAFQ